MHFLAGTRLDRLHLPITRPPHPRIHTQTAFDILTENVSRGVDAVDYTVTFWEKFIKLERAYAKVPPLFCDRSSTYDATVPRSSCIV